MQKAIADAISSHLLGVTTAISIKFGRAIAL
jgi:hypothetical protein